MLRVMLLLNAAMFLAEFSAGLLDDSRDMLAADLVERPGVLWPDIVIGLMIAAVVVRSAVRVVREARVRLSGDRGVNGPGSCVTD